MKERRTPLTEAPGVLESPVPCSDVWLPGYQMTIATQCANSNLQLLLRDAEVVSAGVND